MAIGRREVENVVFVWYVLLFSGFDEAGHGDAMLVGSAESGDGVGVSFEEEVVVECLEVAGVLSNGTWGELSHDEVVMWFSGEGGKGGMAGWMDGWMDESMEKAV